jgi:hypothetical protein
LTYPNSFNIFALASNYWTPPRITNFDAPLGLSNDIELKNLTNYWFCNNCRLKVHFVIQTKKEGMGVPR